MNGASGLRTKKQALRIPCVDGLLKRIITRSESFPIQCHRGCAAKNRADTTHRSVVSEVYKYWLLTKLEAKMAGYWPSSCFCVFMGRDGSESRSIKRDKHVRTKHIQLLHLTLGQQRIFYLEKEHNLCL